MDVDFYCLHCKQALSADEQTAGKQVKCPSCGVPLLVPKKTAKPKNLSAEDTQGVRRFNCPSCKQTLKAPAEMVGQLMDCPSCKNTIEVPYPPPPVPTPAKQQTPREQSIKCVGCGEVLATDTVLCTSCGTNQKTGQKLQLQAEEPTSDEPSQSEPSGSRACPFCGETILIVAIKCKHCGEFLDERQPTPQLKIKTVDRPVSVEATASAEAELKACPSCEQKNWSTASRCKRCGYDFDDEQTDAEEVSHSGMTRTVLSVIFLISIGALCLYVESTKDEKGQNTSAQVTHSHHFEEGFTWGFNGGKSDRAHGTQDNTQENFARSYLGKGIVDSKIQLSGQNAAEDFWAGYRTGYARATQGN